MWVYCMDGFHMSVIDADEMPLAYCDDTSVEIGFPSEKEEGAEYSGDTGEGSETGELSGAS